MRDVKDILDEAQESMDMAIRRFFGNGFRIAYSSRVEHGF